MADPYAGYDVLAKRDTPSWNDKTRDVVDRRMSLRGPEAVLTGAQHAVLARLVERIAPQPERRAPANTLAMLTRRIADDEGDGYRPAALPRFAECWRRILDALDAEAREVHGEGFAALAEPDADALLQAVSEGRTQAGAWSDLPPERVWKWRIIPDILAAHWAQPALWSDMGFGGPASPRGYVRLDANRRDPWEAREEH